MTDPDNRRPVDYGAADSDWLEEFTNGKIERAGELLERWQDGRIKLAMTATILRYRRDHPELFAAGRV